MKLQAGTFAYKYMHDLRQYIYTRPHQLCWDDQEKWGLLSHECSQACMTVKTL